MIKKFEASFEHLLWNSRFVVLIAVICSLLIAFTVFYIATVDAIYTIHHAFEYGQPGLDGKERSALRASIITHVVEIVDGYLLATVLLIFALGLYELFISKIDLAENSDRSSNVLLIHSLDDLKNRLAKVILMILIVRFFEYAIGMSFTTALDLLMLSGGIALIGLALYLSHQAENKH